MAERNWCRFKKNVAEKRTKKKASKEKEKVIPDGDTIVIQRLSAEVSGKAQKYARVGAREFVPFHEYGEFSIQNIKSACMKYFDVPQGMCCDVLAGEQGPSCISVKQIPDYKVIHVRFVERSDAPEVTDATNDASTSTKLPKKRKLENPISNPVPSKRAAPSKFVPRSLSVVEMLKLGKAINNTSTIVEIQSFDIKAMVWSGKPTNVDFIIDAEPFGTGGFRKALKATSSDREFNNSTWVVKRYLPKAISDIVALGQTVEQQTKKVVQMHYLARNFAAKLKEEVIKQDLVDMFGETLQYKKIYFGKITDTDECVTVEEFVEGTFEKHINNNGEICSGKDNPLTEKAECLAHFSYERSNKELMVVDIQGCGHSLFDPEIASKELMSHEEVLFCTGNLAANAINAFIDTHKCNGYCELLELALLQ